MTEVVHNHVEAEYASRLASLYRTLSYSNGRDVDFEPLLLALGATVDQATGSDHLVPAGCSSIANRYLAKLLDFCTSVDRDFPCTGPAARAFERLWSTGGWSDSVRTSKDPHALIALLLLCLSDGARTGTIWSSEDGGRTTPASFAELLIAGHWLHLDFPTYKRQKTPNLLEPRVHEKDMTQLFFRALFGDAWWSLRAPAAKYLFVAGVIASERPPFLPGLFSSSIPQDSMLLPSLECVA